MDGVSVALLGSPELALLDLGGTCMSVLYCRHVA